MQVVELDFLYPSEGIHRRWENGYRITSIAGTCDQSAFVLSVPRRKPSDETQETLRTSAFPSNHVKVCFSVSSIFFVLAFQNFVGCNLLSFLSAGKMGQESLHFVYLLRSNCFMKLF